MPHITRNLQKLEANNRDVFRDARGASRSFRTPVTSGRDLPGLPSWSGQTCGRGRPSRGNDSERPSELTARRAHRASPRRDDHGRRSCRTSLFVRRETRAASRAIGTRTERIDTEEAALVAPGLPIASVPTGARPASGRSRAAIQPLERGALHGHTEHGKRVVRRHHAGGCAAPPAQQSDIDSAPFRSRRKLGHPYRVRCAESDIFFHRERRSAPTPRRHVASSPNRRTNP